jgi:hypothetical protein
MSFYFGVKWDEYTSTVATSLTKDIVAMKNNYPLLDLICCCDDANADRIFKSFNIKRIVNNINKAKLYILYSVTSDKFIEAPESANTVIIRNLEIKINRPNIDPNPKSGYYLKDGDRPGPNSSPSSKPMPNYNGTPDSTVKLMWG